MEKYQCEFFNLQKQFENFTKLIAALRVLLQFLTVISAAGGEKQTLNN